MGNIKVVTFFLAVYVFRGSHTAELCLAGDFDSQFGYILQSQLLSDERITNMSLVFNDVERILRARWPGAVVIPFGSVVVGLGLKSSDTDCYAVLPSQISVRDRITEIIKLMKQYPTIYQQVYPQSKETETAVNFFHAPTQVLCDLCFTTQIHIVTAKLMNYYMYLDERVRPVTAFLKIWSQVHGITNSKMLPSYGIALLAIFYFQQKKILPPASILQRNAAAHYIKGWNTGYELLPYETRNTDGYYELMRGFFEYYSEFDFENYMVSPYAGRPIHKSEFSDVESVPEEFVLYKRRVREGSCEPAQLDTQLWLQDIFSHNVRVTNGNNRRLSEQFIFHVKSAARSFATLPKDQVLRAILKTHADRDVIGEELSSIDTISENENCATET